MGMTLKTFYDIYELKKYIHLDAKAQVEFRKTISKDELDRACMQAFGEIPAGYSKDKKIRAIKIFVETQRRNERLDKGIIC